MNKLLPFVLIFTATVFLSCNKARLNDDTSIAEDHTLAQVLWDDIARQVDGGSAAGENKSEVFDTWNDCISVTVDSSSAGFPITVTLDFGESNCEGLDGRKRRGRLIYTISGHYRVKGTVITLSCNDYYVNDYRVEGTRVVTNTGENADGYLQFSVEITDGVITTPENEMVTWESGFTAVWTEGSETGFFTPKDSSNVLGVEGILDDVYDITGSGNGSNRDGRLFDVEISSALRWELDCRWITQGEILLKPQDLETRIVNYGEGTCDNEATVRIGSKNHTIELSN